MGREALGDLHAEDTELSLVRIGLALLRDISRYNLNRLGPQSGSGEPRLFPAGSGSSLSSTGEMTQTNDVQKINFDDSRCRPMIVQAIRHDQRALVASSETARPKPKVMNEVSRLRDMPESSHQCRAQS